MAHTCDIQRAAVWCAVISTVELITWHGVQLPGADSGRAHCTAAKQANFTPEDFRAIFVASCAGQPRSMNVRCVTFASVATCKSCTATSRSTVAYWKW